MKKIFTILACVGLLTACHINTPEPEVPEETDAYEAIGTLLIPTSGFTKEDLRTKVVLVDEEHLDIYMFDVKFATAMPVTIDMVISGVPYEQHGSTISFYGDSIVPYAGNKPYEKYVVTELEGSITADSMFISNNYGDTPSIYTGALKQ